MTTEIQTSSTTISNAARPTLTRTPSGSMSTSSRRPDLRLTLSSTEKADFSAAIDAARNHITSDASALPKSTNMGLSNGSHSQSYAEPGSSHSRNTSHGSLDSIASHRAAQLEAQMQRQISNASNASSNNWPIPQPIAEKDRLRYDTEHEKTIKTHNEQAHSWEEEETFASASSLRKTPPSPKAVFLRAIPCMYVANVANALTFYKDILGFTLLGKADTSYASLVRTPDGGLALSRTKNGGTVKRAPADAIELYLRIHPMGVDGQRVKPPPMTLWIMVNDVDLVHKELLQNLSKFEPRTDEYFPMHSFGDAKITQKPQNKAWGNREMHITDGDENKIIFFRSLQ